MKYIYVLSLLCFITAADAAVVERPATRARVVGLATGTGLGVTNLGAGVSGTGVALKNLGVGGSATNLTALNQNVGANSNFATNSSVEKFTTNTTTGKEKEDATTEIAVKEVAKELLNMLNEKKSDQTCSLPQIKNADGKCVDAQVLSLDDLRYGMNAKSKENAKVATDYCWGKFYKDDYSLCVLGYKVFDVFANGVAGDNKTTSETTDSETGTTSKSEDSSAGAGTESADASSKSEDSSAGAGTESADTSSKSSNSGSDTNSSAQDKAIETFSSMMGNTVAKGFDTSLFGTNTTNTTSGSNTTAPTVSSTTTKTGGGVGSVTNSTVGKVQSIFGGSVGGLFKW